MASSQSFVEAILDLVVSESPLTYRKMFGEYALYHRGKVVAFVCDDRLLLKPTAAGRERIGNPVEQELFPGSKPHFHLENELENPSELALLLRITYDALPEPKPKSSKRSAPKTNPSPPGPRRRRPSFLD